MFKVGDLVFRNSTKWDYVSPENDEDYYRNDSDDIDENSVGEIVEIGTRKPYAVWVKWKKGNTNGDPYWWVHINAISIATPEALRKVQQQAILDKIKYLNDRKKNDKPGTLPPKGIYRGQRAVFKAQGPVTNSQTARRVTEPLSVAALDRTIIEAIRMAHNTGFSSTSIRALQQPPITGTTQYHTHFRDICETDSIGIGESSSEF